MLYNAEHLTKTASDFTQVMVEVETQDVVQAIELSASQIFRTSSDW